MIEEVHAPRWLHRFIIGRKGQNVQKITQDLPKVHVEFNSDLDKIILEGPPEQVQQAKEAFETFTEDLVCVWEGGVGERKQYTAFFYLLLLSILLYLLP